MPLSKLNCPHCRLANWSTVDVCLRCKKSMKTAVSVATPARMNIPLPKDYVSPAVIAIVLFLSVGGVFAVYKFVFAMPNKEIATTNVNAPTPATLTQRIRYAYDQDAAYWQVRHPDLIRLTNEFKPQVEGSLGDFITTSEGGAEISSRGHTSIDGYTGRPTAHSVPNKYFNALPTRGRCGGKVENMVASDYWYLKEGENVTLKVEFEGDFFVKKATGRNSCGELRAEGRKSVQNAYVWYRGKWMEIVAATADPNFKDSVLKPDTLALGIAEKEKNDKIRRQEQKELEARHERYRAMRANRNAAP